MPSREHQAFLNEIEKYATLLEFSSGKELSKYLLESNLPELLQRQEQIIRQHPDNDGLHQLVNSAVSRRQMEISQTTKR